MALTEEMLDWLTKHTGYAGASKGKKKGFSKQMEEFWRRLEKIRAALAEVPADSPLKGPLQNRLDQVVGPFEGRKDVRQSELKAAYKQLNTIKADARVAARTTKSSITLPQILATVNPTVDKIKRLKNSREGTKDWFEAQILEIKADVNNIPAVSATATTFKEALDQLEQVKIRTAMVRNDLDTLENDARQALANWDNDLKTPPSYDDVIKLTELKAKIYLEAHPGHNIDAVQSALFFVLNAMKSDDIKSVSGFRSDLNEMMRVRRLEIETELKRIEDISGFATGTDTDDEGNQLTPQEQQLKDEEMAERFRHLEQRDQQRLERAKQAYTLAVMQDQIISPEYAGVRPGDRAKDIDPLPKFDGQEFFETLPDMPLDGATDREIAEVTLAAATRMLNAVIDIKKMDPKSDVLFDMACKSKDGWIEEIMDATGLVGNLEDLPEAQQKVLNGMADQFYDILKKEYPNKTSEDFSTFTLDGDSYTKKKKLGNGAMGEVWIYENSRTGEEIVLKTSLNARDENTGDLIPEKRDEMEKEARNHHRIMGGGHGDGHQNVTAMKGLVMGPLGEPLVAMELAESGDGQAFQHGASVATRTGLIPETARMALAKASMRDIVRGLKAMHDQGVTHFDVKQLNIFVDKDGRMKVGDFGCGDITERTHEKVKGPEETTPTTMPDEIQLGDELSDKSDSFMLGAMLDLWTSEYERLDEAQAQFKFSTPTRGQTTDDPTGAGKAVMATSLDRLRNALLEQDPEKRPSMDAVLFSSFLSDVDESYTEDDVAELREAQAAYAKALGKAVWDHNWEINRAQRDIKRLELAKVGSENLPKCKLLRQQADMFERKLVVDTRKRDRHPVGSEEWQKLEKRRESSEKYAKEFAEEFEEAYASLGQAKTSKELEKIEADLKRLHEKVKHHMGEIEKLHADPKYKDILERLQKAGEPFKA